MKYNLKEMKLEDKPREKLIQKGTFSLTDAELIAILLHTGTIDYSAIDVAYLLLDSINNLSDLQNITIEELTSIKGIGKTKAITILACIELGKRVMNFKRENYQIKCSRDCFLYLKDRIDYLSQEHFYVVYLNTNNEVIKDKLISIGTSSKLIFENKDVIKWAIKLSSYGLIMVHNHPSGNPLPSKEDIEITFKLKQACSLVDLVLIDHIIIGKNKYYSFKDKCTTKE